MKKISETFKARRAAKLQAEDGFSLIDVVVTVAIIVALSVGGFIAYNGIIGNAQESAVKGAADQVYTAAVTAYNSGGSNADLATAVTKVVDDYNESSDVIKVNAYLVTGTDGVSEILVSANDASHGKYTERGAGANDDGSDNGTGLATDATGTLPSGD